LKISRFLGLTTDYEDTYNARVPFSVQRRLLLVHGPICVNGGLDIAVLGHIRLGNPNPLTTASRTSHFHRRGRNSTPATLPRLGSRVRISPGAPLPNKTGHHIRALIAAGGDCPGKVSRVAREGEVPF